MSHRNAGITRSTPLRSTPPGTTSAIFIARTACADVSRARAWLVEPMSPAVSIILPTYDRLPLLRDAVASVLAQTVQDWELFVVDDGSTDGTVEWLESLGDPRIVAIPQEH